MVGFLVALAVLAAAPMAPTGAQAAPVEATVDRAGFWSAVQGTIPTSGTPLNGVVPPIPTSPTVPANSLPVAAFAGRPQYETGIGISFASDIKGGSVAKLTLTLDAAPNGAAGDQAASIIACPITTTLWVDAQNGKWSDRPEADCTKAQSKGTRNSDGSWTFDLAAIAATWTDPFEAIPTEGVLLMPGDTTSTFQVAFKDASQGGIHLDSDVTAASGNTDEAFAAPISLPADSGSSLSGSSGDLSSTPAPVTAVAPAVPAGSPRPAVRPTIAPTARVGPAAGKLANLSPWLLFLVPAGALVALGAAAAANHRPATDTPRRRQGGVSRALQRSAPRSAPESP